MHIPTPAILAALLAAAAAVQGAPRPHILLIHTDDIGPGDISAYNPQGKIKTPAIDALAASGLRFTHAHTPAALCAPTRYAILSGNYPWRGRYPGGDWNWHTDTQFLPGQQTFGHFAQAGGYRTAFFGKANLGAVYEKSLPDGSPDFSSKLSEGPIQWGFDYSYIIPRGHMTFPYVYYENNTLVGDPKAIVTLKAGPQKAPGSVVTSDGPGHIDWDSTAVGRTLADKAVAFIDDTLAQHPGKPFLIHFNTDGAHGPHTAAPELFGRKLKGETITPQTDMIYETDILTGRLVAALKERGLYANTLIIYTSDNGGIPADKKEKFDHDAVNGLRGSKATIWEGGTRVPFIAHWGDDTEAGSVIKPARVTSQVIGTHDLAATFAELAGVKPPEGQARDSVSILPVLTGAQPEDKPVRDHLLVQSSPGRDTRNGPIPPELRARFKDRPRPLHAYIAWRVAQAIEKGTDGISHAVIKNGWKLIFGLDDQPEFLADLNTDPAEATNLLDKPENKARIDELTAIYRGIRKDWTPPPRPAKKAAIPPKPPRRPSATSPSPPPPPSKARNSKAPSSPKATAPSATPSISPAASPPSPTATANNSPPSSPTPPFPAASPSPPPSPPTNSPSASTAKP
jgi:arylsulfatase A-like enzyme